MEGFRKSLQTRSDVDNNSETDEVELVLPSRTLTNMATISNAMNNGHPTTIGTIATDMTHISRLRKFISDMDATSEAAAVALVKLT